MADGTARSSSGGGNSLKPSHNHGLHLFLSRLAAFTLAEVLITLGIIGVVAALTLPSLVANYKKKEVVTRLKYSYSVLAQAIMLSENDNGFESEWVLDKSVGSGSEITKNFVKTYIEPYLKKVGESKYTTSSALYEYYYYKDGELKTSLSHSLYSIVLANGICLSFNANYSRLDNIDVRVDINGKKGPNIIGRDTFVFEVYPKLKAKYVDKDRETLLRFCKLNTGYDSNIIYYRTNGCTALIMRDGWQISKDYPW